MDEKDKKKIFDTILLAKYNGEETPKVWADVERVILGEPLDYVIGHTDFLGARIDLSERPLIPREETEYWVLKAINLIKNTASSSKRCYFLDLFSGSGCIGIALLKHFPASQVDFVDSEGLCIRQIRRNIAINSLLESRTRVYRNDVFPPMGGKYDYIFVNPPYIDEGSEDTVSKSVLDYEPREALFAPYNGLFLIKKVIDGVGDFLSEGGTVFIEFGENQKEEIGAYVKKSKRFNEITFWKDQFDRDRVVVLKV